MNEFKVNGERGLSDEVSVFSPNRRAGVGERQRGKGDNTRGGETLSERPMPLGVTALGNSALSSARGHQPDLVSQPTHSHKTRGGGRGWVIARLNDDIAHTTHGAHDHLDLALVQRVTTTTDRLTQTRRSIVMSCFICSRM